MKRIAGIILLVLALLGAVGVVKQFARSHSARPMGSRAYESGRKAGQYTAAVFVLLLGGAGAWLLFSERRAVTPRTPGLEPLPAGKPWYQTTGGIVGLSVGGGIVGLLLLLLVLAVVSNLVRRHPAPPPPATDAVSPPPPSVRGGNELTQAGPFSVGTRVEAHWGGRWVPGKVTRVNPGGFSLMVQLEDARFSHPIVLSTNQLRLR